MTPPTGKVVDSNLFAFHWIFLFKTSRALYCSQAENIVKKPHVVEPIKFKDNCVQYSEFYPAHF